jgi:hypothetical protein
VTPDELRRMPEAEFLQLPATFDDPELNRIAGERNAEILARSDGHHSASQPGQAGQPGLDSENGVVEPKTSPDPRPGLDPDSTPDLLLEEDILPLFLADLARAGVAGELRIARIIYLCVTSRVLPWGVPTNRPVSFIARGTTSSGKSHTQKMTLKFFPPEAYFDLGTASPKYLVYSDERLEHRFVVIGEWAQIAEDDDFVASLRALLSEGQLIHGTVEGNNRKEGRRIVKAGPTGLLMTTTAAAVDPELETRCLSDRTDDSPEQTRRVLQTLAEVDERGYDERLFASWHEAQRWLAAYGETRVRIPYLGTLANLMPTDTVRLRRDFVSLVCLIKAHAILHQLTRDRNGDGEIAATMRDYEVAASLIDELVAEEADRNASPAIRETVVKTAELLEETDATFASKKQITDKLEVGRSAGYDRINRAILKGYLVDAAPKGSRVAQIQLGTPLPDGQRFLPTVEELESGPSPIRQPDSQTRVVEREDGSSPGRPGRPDDPPVPDAVRRSVWDDAKACWVVVEGSA